MRVTNETFAVQFLADGAGYRGTKLGEPPGFRINNQVDITHAHPRLRIAKAGVLVGKRAQRLGCDRKGLGEHGQLTGARRNDLAGDADVVAQINVRLPGGERFIPDPV
jgi:hypothetical protein